MRGCDVSVRSVEEYFEGRRFEIPGYQREYSWPDSLVAQFVDDLAVAWQKGGPTDHDEGQYFIGLIVTSKAEDEPNHRLVDGQQRTTTLVLLLKALAERGSDDLRERINALIDATPQRFVFATAGFRDALAAVAGAATAARRGRRRSKTAQMGRLEEAYRVIVDRLDALIGSDADEISDFADWLLESVFIVDLVDTDPFDDQLLFDRINSRSLHLSSADTYRSRVAAQVGVFSKGRFIDDWRKARATAAKAYGLSPTTSATEAERLAMTAWLVGRFASRRDDFVGAIKEAIRDPYDWAYGNLPDLCGGEDRVPDLFRSDFFKLVDELGWPVGATKTFQLELAGFYSAALAKFPLTDALAAAVMRPARKGRSGDDLRTLSRFLDSAAARSMWGTGWCSTNAQRMDLLSRALRECATHTGDTLRSVLSALLANSPTFDPEEAPSLASGNKTWVRYFLSRLSEHIERTLRGRTDTPDLFSKSGQLEIEHLMGDHYPHYREAFGTPRAWQAARERLGALTLLAKKTNAHLREKAFEDKLEKYADETAITAAISVHAYNGSVTLLKGAKSNGGLDLHPIDSMTPEAIAQRERLYCQIAEKVWPRSI